MHAHADVLRELFVTGAHCDRHRHLAAAFSDDSCHLCHGSLGAHNEDFPCLHWCLNGHIGAGRMCRVFSLYRAHDFLVYLCVVVQAELERGKRATMSVRHDGHVATIAARIGSRKYALVLSEESDSVEVAFSNVRSQKTSSLRIPCDNEIATMMARWRNAGAHDALTLAVPATRPARVEREHTP
jgi:hypothetical protein